jgi:hypothetical protein
MKSETVSRLGILALVCACLLGGIHFLEWMGNSLGQSPVLDARENLGWAERIAQGELPREPFYRALLYPALLAVLPAPIWLGPVFGLACHLLNAGLCVLLARRVWGGAAAGWLAGGLYALYPVAVYFSVQLLDITFSLTLFLLGTYLLLGLRESAKVWCALLSGLAAGAAVLARPNFLPPVLLFPVLALGFAYLGTGQWRSALKHGIWVLFPIAGLLGLQGTINYKLSGEFRIMPWQGAYNLYAANTGDANGKFFKQQVGFDYVPEGMNPTRMESEYLYRQAIGPEADLDVGEMNAYWRGQLFQEMEAEPLRWLGLMGRKVVYLFNDWEQYNNLSYEYQKGRFTLLRWNPLGWGILLIGALVAPVLAWRSCAKPEAAGLLLLAAAYAAGVLLFFVSARFRLPIAPFLAIGAAGLVCVPWRALGRGQWLGLIGAALGGGVLIFGNWLGARTTETFRQDQLLLAIASAELGRDAEALDYASQALDADPGLDGARRIWIASLFNLWLVEGVADAEDAWDAIGLGLKELNQSDAASEFIRGVAHWRAGERTRARQVWIEAVRRYGDGAAASAHALEWLAAKRGESLSAGAVRMGELLERVAAAEAAGTPD